MLRGRVPALLLLLPVALFGPPRAAEAGFLSDAYQAAKGSLRARRLQACGVTDGSAAVTADCECGTATCSMGQYCDAMFFLFLFLYLLFSGGMKGLAFVLDPDGYWIEVNDAVHG